MRSADASQWAVVADDLTGAADAAAGFAQRGWGARIHLRSDLDVEPCPIVNLVTTNARGENDQTAARLTACAIERLAHAGASRLFLKIDSAARGSIAGQIEGALRAWQSVYRHATALICPAFPEQGRVIRHATVLIEGRAVADSPTAFDPIAPRSVGDLTLLIPGSEASVIGAQTARVAVVDAATDEDLDAIAHYISDAPDGVIAVGSGGLAAALARILPSPRTPAPSLSVARSSSRPVIVAVSSLHPSAAAQVRSLAMSDLTGVKLIGLDAARMVGPSEALREFASRVSEAVIEHTPDQIVLVGGDGANAVLGRWGATAVDIHGAMLPGCPIGTIIGGSADGLRVVTKSGGFGGRDLLVKLVQSMRRLGNPTGTSAEGIV